MINLIAALTYFPEIDEFVVGIDGKLPHTCPEDMSRFKKLTAGGVVIMGRKTYESLGKPLPDRINVVLSTTERTPPPGTLLSTSLEAALKFAELQHSNKEVWIIGGGKVYKEALEKDIPDRLYISEMKKEGVEDIIDAKDVAVFPYIDTEDYKALYIEQFEDHFLKIFSKTSLDVL